MTRLARIFILLAAAVSTLGAGAAPQHVLSLCTSATDTMVRLGAGGQLAAMDEYSRIVPGTSNVAVIGRGGAISREQVLALHIDLAFVWQFQEDAARLLEDLSVPVVKVRCGRAAEVPEMIRLVGTNVGRAEAADRLSRELAARFQALANSSATNPARVYFELYGAYKTMGRDSFLNDVIELSGGTNIAAGASGTVLLSPERLMASEPDVIIFVNGFGDAIAQRGSLSRLAAVRNRRVHGIDRYWLVAGAGLPDAVARLRALISEK